MIMLYKNRDNFTSFPILMSFISNCLIALARYPVNYIPWITTFRLQINPTVGDLCCPNSVHLPKAISIAPYLFIYFFLHSPHMLWDYGLDLAFTYLHPYPPAVPPSDIGALSPCYVNSTSKVKFHHNFYIQIGSRLLDSMSSAVFYKRYSVE